MKRHESLRPLSREHHTALILARLLRKDAPLYKGLPDTMEGKAQYAAGLFSSQLKKHFEQEEKLFSSLQAYHPSIVDMLEAIRQEHRQLEKLFALLSAGNYSSDSMDELGKYLESHIRKEERVYFPFIESNCPGSALNAFI